MERCSTVNIKGPDTKEEAASDRVSGPEDDKQYEVFEMLA